MELDIFRSLGVVEHVLESCTAQLSNFVRSLVQEKESPKPGPTAGIFTQPEEPASATKFYTHLRAYKLARSLKNRMPWVVLQNASISPEMDAQKSQSCGHHSLDSLNFHRCSKSLWPFQRKLLRKSTTMNVLALVHAMQEGKPEPFTFGREGKCCLLRRGHWLPPPVACC